MDNQINRNFIKALAFNLADSFHTAGLDAVLCNRLLVENTRMNIIGLKALNLINTT